MNCTLPLRARGAGPTRPLRTGSIAIVEKLESRAMLDAGSTALPVVGAPTQYASLDAYKQALIDRAVAQYADLFGRQIPRTWPGPIVGPWFPFDGVRVGPVPLIASDALLQAQGTNNQVPGVEEADSVETDGRYLYILSGNELVIVDGAKPESPTIVSRTKLGDGTHVAEYLHDGKLTVLSTTYGDSPISLPGRVAISSVSSPAIDARPVGWSMRGMSQVRVETFDVSDPAHPTGLGATTLDGSYSTSRMVGDRLVLVMQNGSPWIPGPELKATDDGAVYETKEEYIARVQASLDPSEFLPRWSTADGSGAATGSGPVVTADGIVKLALGTWANLMSIVVLDVSKPGTAPTSAIAGEGQAGNTVYVSQNHVYLFNEQWVVDDGPFNGHPVTFVREFGIDGDAVTAVAQGVLPGRPLNSFSIDEYAGTLRVATTALERTADGSNQTDNNLYVMKPIDGVLTTIGSVTGLAPGESIFAVRFLGERAFIVTFRRIDPLFGVDLSDPTAPRNVGELKVDGFSRYLQPIDANHLVGIGRDVSATGRLGALLVSLFDVSDLANPKLVGTATAGSDSDWIGSLAEYDHHAITYVAEQGLLAVPYQTYNQSMSGWASPIAGWFDNGLLIFHVDAATGVTFTARVATGASMVARSVVVGDALFAVSQYGVTAVSLADPTRVLGSVTIQTPWSPGPGDANPGDDTGVHGETGPIDGDEGTRPPIETTPTEDGAAPVDTTPPVAAAAAPRHGPKWRQKQLALKKKAKAILHAAAKSGKTAKSLPHPKGPRVTPAARHRS